MRWGDRYGADYVNRLFAMAARHLSAPHRFVCLTDNTAGIRSEVECRPLPAIELADAPPHSGWRKLSCLSPELDDLGGPVLFLDLDLVIVASIDCLFAHPGAFCIIENWTQRGRGIGNSSVFRFEAGAHRPVLQRFCADAATDRPQLAERADLSFAIGRRGDLLAAKLVPQLQARLPAGPAAATVPGGQNAAGCQDHRVPRRAEAARCGPRRLAAKPHRPPSCFLDRGTLALIKCLTMACRLPSLAAVAMVATKCNRLAASLATFDDRGAGDAAHGCEDRPLTGGQNGGCERTAR